MKKTAIAALIAGYLLSSNASADIISSSKTHFELRHEAASSLAPDALWERLIQPAIWWHPDHTYSGDANNLSLEAKVGGLWREDWDGGSVAHGTVMFIQPGKTLRMQAPFGPLQGLGAYAVWTITISANDEGSKVVFDEVASGPSSADLEELAMAVNYVKQEAILRLVAPTLP